MRKLGRKKRFIHNIKNQQFRRLFLKNWFLVFLSIMLTLFFCATAIQYYSNRSMIQEIEAAVQRSVRNTKATLETLFEEVCDTLEKERMNQDIIGFLQIQRTNPAEYRFSEKVNAVLEQLAMDQRDNLYFSLDVYAPASQFLASTLYRGQLAEWISDHSLIETFEQYRQDHPEQMLFAAARTAQYLGEKKQVITVYRIVTISEKKEAFVSVSVDAEKLIGYITDNKNVKQGAYMIVDENQKVLLDTSGKLSGQKFALPEAAGNISSIEESVNGREMMISWVDMDVFGWKCVHMIPMEEYQYNSVRLQHTIFLIVSIGIFASLFLSYVVSSRLFRPVEAILRVLENPGEPGSIGEQKGEIQYLLLRILELFQKNISLEREMLDRVSALRRARAKALQEQMTPHFINNVLQTINWIAVEETGEENSLTSQSIILLAEILETGKNQKYCLTTVEKELDYTRKFVELERLRYGTGIVCHYEVDPDVMDMPIPGISLQTLVENSISHGFRTRGGCGNIYISIHANEKGGVNISVEDDGEGIEPEKIERIFVMLEQDEIYVGEHLGLINFFQRFLLIYGDSCSFVIKNGSLGGAFIEVSTPEISKEWGQPAGQEK